MTVTLKVEVKQPSSSELAMKLAEAMNNELLFREEHTRFSWHTDSEERKARDLEILLDRVKQRDELLAKGLPPPPTTSRMDPMLTYSASALEEEIVKCRTKSIEFRAKATISAKKAEDCKHSVLSLQTEVRRAVERERAAK